MQPNVIAFLCIAGLSLQPIAVHASSLSQFEQDATQHFPSSEDDKANEKPDLPTCEEDEEYLSTPSAHQSNRWDEEEECEPETFSEAMGTLMFQLVGLALGYGGMSSIARVVPPDPEDDPEESAGLPAVRHLGEPLTPYLRVERHWQEASGGISGTDWRVEGGWGPLGLQHHAFEFRQGSTRLDITQTHGLYRMMFSEYVGIDLGLGKATMKGEESHDAFSITTPLQVQFGRYAGAQLRPSWSYFGENNPTRIVDFTVRAGTRFVSAQAGLRWMKALDTKLDGTFLGLSVHF